MITVTAVTTVTKIIAVVRKRKCSGTRMPLGATQDSLHPVEMNMIAFLEFYVTWMMEDDITANGNIPAVHHPLPHSSRSRMYPQGAIILH